MQTQLFCTGFKYCDFILYTKEDIHVERITLDVKFMEDRIPSAAKFFENCIMPELLGHWFSRPANDVYSSSDHVVTSGSSLSTSDYSLQLTTTSISDVPSTSASNFMDISATVCMEKTDGTDGTRYCYCQEGEYGEMVACDNSKCPYQWFHLEYLNLLKPPKGKL